MLSLACTPWWKLFRFQLWEDGLVWLTPCFLLCIADGACAVNRFVYWWGMSICWGLRSDRQRGEEIFRHEKRWEMRIVTGEEMYRRRHATREALNAA